ncbi:MAG TPA: MmgE/PrpD family protein [Candidatus Angelobacter sp.]
MTARAFAEFIVSARAPEKALAIARTAFLDATGVALAGAVEPGSRIVQKLASAEASGCCHIWGTPLKTSATWAALANGAAAHALDFDDMCFVSLAHPSAPLVAATLAAGEQAQTSGRTVLEAYVIGFEIEAILGRTMNPRHYQQGWHCTSTIGTVGAAAAAARLLALDAETATHCLAIAASEASGLKENFGAMTKPLHAGLAARNAVLAALLAQQGFTANEHALDGPQGFLAAMASEKPDLQPLAENLGRHWEILETGITVKLYPSCAATHPALDAVLDLRRQHNLAVDLIESVEVQVDAVTPPLLTYDRPETGLQGKFSMPFCIAAALVYGQVGLDTFEPSRIHDSRIQQMLPRVTMRVNPALGLGAPALTQAIVKISLGDGRVLLRNANGARGYPAHPASAEEIDKKFLSCGRHALPEDRLQAALDRLHQLEALPDVRQLTESLGIEPAG